jgi:hypothetical protein
MEHISIPTWFFTTSPPWYLEADDAKWDNLTTLDSQAKQNIYTAFYEKVNDRTHKCVICAAAKRSKHLFSFNLKDGYQNPMSHVQSFHKSLVHERLQSLPKKKNTITNYLPQKISSEAQDIHGWMRLVVMEDQPFRTVESPQFLEFSKYQRITRVTLMKYLRLSSVCSASQY